MIRLNRTNTMYVCFTALIALAHSTASVAQNDAEGVSLTEAALRGPAVASVLEAERETPAEQLNAVFVLLDLGEQDLARTLWQDFARQELKATTKAELVSRFGTARFLNLARRESTDELAGTRQFAESCLDAASQLRRDPERVAQLINQLSDDSTGVRRAARADLAVTGDTGVIACLEALAQAAAGDADKQLRTELMLTLAKMRPGVEPMLIAALADGEGQFRRDIVELTGYIHLHDATPWLAAIAAGADSDPDIVSAAYAALAKFGVSSPTGMAAQAALRSEIRRLDSKLHDPIAESPWWSYDAAQQRIVARDVTSPEKKLLSIARVANVLGKLPNASPADRRLALIYAYQVAELLQQPLPAEFRQWNEGATVVELSETLAEAIQDNQITAAIACTKLLGERADVAALNTASGQRSSLAVALAHADHRLRFAALETVIKIAPTHSFAGASGVSPALWYFAASAGEPQAIAASSVTTRASDWAGQLRGLGYDATPVATGREALLTALDSPRLELILVDSDIGRPRVREVIYQLRSRPRIARVPIAILSSLHNLPRAEQIAAADPWLLATPRLHSREAMQGVIGQLYTLGPAPFSAEQRTEQAATALGWIADLLESGHPYDELLRDSHSISKTLYNPDLTAASLRVLSLLGTAESQKLLLDFISSPVLPIESRREAATAFGKTVHRFGKLLTSEELLLQYDRYNASETADVEKQQVLGKVLDILEEKTKK